VVGRVDSQGKEKSCVDYARSYVRGFITVYMAWFLGVDAEDGFWTTYFKPLERLWTINRAQKDISLMRGEGLVMEDRLRLTEKGWQCMEEAIAKFLKGKFGEHQSISIVKEYPVTTLVAPGFAYDQGIDLLDMAELKREGRVVTKTDEKGAVDVQVIKRRYCIIGHTKVEDKVVRRIECAVDDFEVLLAKLLDMPELDKNQDFMKVRVALGLLVGSALRNREFYMSMEARPSKWLIPIIPYLVNMGFEVYIEGITTLAEKHRLTVESIKFITDKKPSALVLRFYEYEQPD
jgi:hypothetical protein